MDSGGPTLYLLSAAIGGLAGLALAFAALALFLRWRNAVRARRWGALEARWERTLLEVLAGDAPADALAPLVAPRDGSFFVGMLMRYARRLRGAERDTVVRIAQPYLGRIARQLRLRSAERRARAVQTLSVLGAEAYRDVVRRALDDPSPLVAMVAARALARGRDAEHGAAILARLERFDEWSARYLASMLAGMGAEVAAPLCDTLADPARAAWVRAVAADALTMLHDLPAADVAAAVLGATDDRELLAANLRLLAALGRPAHVPRIRPLASSGDAVVRAMATRALAALGDETVRARLRDALDDPSPWVAHEAAAGLAESGGGEILRALADSDHPRAVLARQALREAAA